MANKDIILENEEKIIVEAILNARKIQEYIWQELSYTTKPFDLNIWCRIFQKRVDKIKIIDPNYPNFKVELRKRILQQAALSIAVLRILDG